MKKGKKMRIVNIHERERIGLRIKELRSKKGLSQRELAEMTGLNYSNIAKIELGKYSVGLDILVQISNALGCEVDIVNNKHTYKQQFQ